jgi:redox-sensitive bicupin YhaK (pirin superfamily)
VGPFCFFDAYGPEVFREGKPMDVAPHPHIGLQTVSWLVDGEVLHKDSLGSTAIARPGALNLMTAGRGIAHSEETPPGGSAERRLFGVQLWVALPEVRREDDPHFEHHAEVPEAALDGGQGRVFLGLLAGARSPARTFSPLVGAELRAASSAGSSARRLVAPLDPGFEHALLLLEGSARLDDRPLEAETLYYLGSGRRDLCLTDVAPRTRVLLIGGAPFEEPVLMWWNFVARSTDEIVAAREDWEAGRRFGAVAAYAGDRIPAPAFVARPVATGRI